MSLVSLAQGFFRNQMARFLSVGAFNTTLGYAVIFAGMYLFGWSAELSNVVGYGVGLAFSFLLSKRFTFRSTGRVMPELLRFLVVFLLAYLANFATLFVCLHTLALHPAVSQIIAGVLYIVTSYWLNHRYVFNQGSKELVTLNPKGREHS
jgi:putative flippase GtrA